MEFESQTSKQTVLLKQYCFECRIRFDQEFQPMILGCCHSEPICSHCVSKIFQNGEKDKECPFCSSEIEQKNVKMDEMTVQLMALLKRRQIETTKKIKSAQENVKATLKNLRQSETRERNSCLYLTKQLQEQKISFTDKILNAEKELKLLKKQFHTTISKKDADIGMLKEELEAMRKHQQSSEVECQKLRTQLQSIKQELLAKKTSQQKLNAQMSSLRQKHNLLSRQKQALSLQLEHTLKHFKQHELHVNEKRKYAYKALIQFAKIQFGEDIQIKIDPAKQTRQKRDVSLQQKPLEVEEESKIEESCFANNEITEGADQKNLQQPKSGEGRKNEMSKLRDESQAQSDESKTNVCKNLTDKTEGKEEEKMKAQKIEKVEVNTNRVEKKESTSSKRKQTPESSNNTILQMLSGEGSGSSSQKQPPSKGQNKDSLAYCRSRPKRQQSPSFYTEPRGEEEVYNSNKQEYRDYTNYYGTHDHQFPLEDCDDYERYESNESYYYQYQQYQREMQYRNFYPHQSQQHYPQQHYHYNLYGAGQIQGGQSKEAISVPAGKRQSKHLPQPQLTKEKRIIQQKIERFKNDKELREQVGNDHVVKYIKELDKMRNLSAEEYFLITDTENSKPAAAKKLQLLISIKKGETDKYKDLRAQVLCYTIDTIKSVWLCGIGLERIIDLSPIESLQRLQLQSNFLRTIKPLQGNTKLQILYLHINALQNLDGLQNMVHLRELSINENKLNDNVYIFLSKCKLEKLQKIALGSTLFRTTPGANDKCLRQFLSRTYSSLREIRFDMSIFQQWQDAVNNYNRLHRGKVKVAHFK